MIMDIRLNSDIPFNFININKRSWEIFLTISFKINMDDTPTVSMTRICAFQLNEIPQNHSKLPHITEENTDMQLMKNVLTYRLQNRIKY